MEGSAPLRAGWDVCTIDAKPVETLAREPSYASKEPLYMTLRIGSGADAKITVVLDESKGTGRGYDTLYVDANNNGDLADDTVLKPQQIKRGGSVSFVVDPLDMTVKYAGGAPRVFRVQLELRGYESGPERRIKWTGAYHVDQHLEGRTAFGDREDVLVGIYDSSTTKRHANGCFSGFGLDRLRIDLDGDGKLHERQEDVPLGRVVLVDNALWSVSLDPAATTLEITPYTGPVGTVRFEGRFASGAALTDVTGFAELTSTNQYALRIPFPGGLQANVPAADYRISRGHLLVDAGKERWESLFFLDGPIRVAPDAGARVVLGAPLKVEPRFEAGGEARLGQHLCVIPYLAGAGGETYENLSPVGTRMHPTVKITDSEGIVASSGQMEYG